MALSFFLQRPQFLDRPPLIHIVRYLLLPGANKVGGHDVLADIHQVDFKEDSDMEKDLTMSIQYVLSLGPSFV